jgi:hypothetical protein
MPAEPRDWWVVHEDDWNDIESTPLPRSGGPFVFANADKSRTWLSDGNKKRNSDPVDKLDPEDHTKTVEESDEPAFWAKVRS